MPIPDEAFWHWWAGPEGRSTWARLKEWPAEAVAVHLHNGGHPWAAEVATQVKLHAQVVEKIPEWYGKPVVLEGALLEQASGQRAVQLKQHWVWGQGDRALDLTAGLGADAWGLAQGYGEVMALEADPQRADLAHFNLGQLAAQRVQVVPADAGAWLAGNKAGFDLLYADPARRGGDRRWADPRQHMPDVLALRASYAQVAPRWVVKCSPLMDVGALLQPPWACQRVTVLAIDGECKEVLAEWNGEIKHPEVQAVMDMRGNRMRLAVPADEAWGEPVTVTMPTPATHRFLLQPDVAMRKCRLGAWMADQIQRHLGQGWGGQAAPEGWWLAAELPQKGTTELALALPQWPGRIWEVLHLAPFEASAWRKELQKRGISKLDIATQQWPGGPEGVRKSLRLQQGGPFYLAVWQHNHQRWAALCLPVRAEGAK